MNSRWFSPLFSLSEWDEACFGGLRIHRFGDHFKRGGEDELDGHFPLLPQGLWEGCPPHVPRASGRRRRKDAFGMQIRSSSSPAAAAVAMSLAASLLFPRGTR